MPQSFISRRSIIAGGAAVAATAQRAVAQVKSLPALIAAAKAEGALLVDGPPIDTVRNELVSGFQNAYGIPVTFIAGQSSTGARVRAERAAGHYLLDVVIGGPDTLLATMLPAGWLDRIEPVLIAPDVIDKRRWKDGHLWFGDPGGTVLRVSLNVFPELAINTKFVKKSDVSTWRSLLEPKWQGKLLARDPASSGAGGSLTSYFYLQFGPDFVKKLFFEQKPMLSRDPRQMAQWLAQGTYPVLVGPDLPQLMQFQKLGYPVEAVFPTDAPSVITGTYGMIALMNKAPHPIAAQLFINWLAGPAAQLAFSKATQALSLRSDLDYGGDVPSYIFPQKGTKYVDTYEYKFVTETRAPTLEKVRQLLGE